MITLKEKKMLLKMKTAMGEAVDELRAEIEAEERKLQEQSESRKAAFDNIFTELSKNLNELAVQDKQRTIEQQTFVEQLGSLFTKIADDPQVPEEIKEELVKIDEPAPAVPNIVDKVVAHVKETTAPSMFVQPEPPTTGRDIQAIQSKLKLLEGWVSKIAMTGPGGGEVNFRYLDDVQRNTMTFNNDSWLLEYDAATKKVQFTEDIGPVRSIKMNTAGHTITPVAGLLSWNVEEDCLDIHNVDGSVLQTGLEQHMRVRNETGATLTNGTVVRFAGVYEDNSHEPIVVPHIANGSVHGLYTVGVLTNDIPNNTIGRATWFGKVHDLDTTGTSSGETWQRGDLLYVHPTLPGKMTNVKPYAPNIVVSTAAVLHVGTTDGILLVRPTIYPRMYYGSFSDTLTQTAAAINTPYAVKLRTTDIASGHHISSNTQVVAEVSGGYNYQFSLQIASSSASKKEVYIWARKNGVDVPDSASRLTITGNDEYRVPSWNFVLPMAANDYFELMWATSDVSVSISAPGATAFCPAIPSAIMTVTQIAL